MPPRSANSCKATRRSRRSAISASSRKARVRRTSSTAIARGAGSTFSLYLKGGEKEAFAFLDALQIANLAVSLGGTETLASAPAAMTHLSVPEERKKQLDITPNLVRISIGVRERRGPHRRLRERASGGLARRGSRQTPFCRNGSPRGLNAWPQSIIAADMRSRALPALCSPRPPLASPASIPVLGPIAGTVAPQLYVISLADAEIPPPGRMSSSRCRVRAALHARKRARLLRARLRTCPRLMQSISRKSRPV